MAKKTANLATPENPENPPNVAPEKLMVKLEEMQGENSDDEEEVPIQAVKIKPELNYTVPHRGARKGENRTERQKEATRKMKEALALKNQQKALQKAQQDEEYKKQLEEKIVKKALSIKKKQIKEQIALDEVSDDDTPIEELLAPVPKRKTIVKTRPTPAPAPAPAPPVIPKQRIVFL
jgi:hypothetical protein